MKPLYKTTIVIWSQDDPTEKYELEDLAREATSGMMYSPSSFPRSECIENPEDDPDWDGTDFFDDEEDAAEEDDCS